jgi:hypothetical protein
LIGLSIGSFAPLRLCVNSVPADVASDGVDNFYGTQTANVQRLTALLPLRPPKILSRKNTLAAAASRRNRRGGRESFAHRSLQTTIVAKKCALIQCETSPNQFTFAGQSNQNPTACGNATIPGGAPFNGQGNLVAACPSHVL